MLTNAWQLAPQKGVLTPTDLDAELERLYADHVAVQYVTGRVGAFLLHPGISEWLSFRRSMTSDLLDNTGGRRIRATCADV
jgi:hypothetical protein